MKTLGKKLIEFGFLEYKPGMKVCYNFLGKDVYGVVEKVTSELEEDLSTLKIVHIQIGDFVVMKNYRAEELRPATLLERIFKEKEFPKAETQKIDSHAAPF